MLGEAVRKSAGSVEKVTLGLGGGGRGGRGVLAENLAREGLANTQPGGRTVTSWPGGARKRRSNSKKLGMKQKFAH